ncbi:hypothetical protein QEH59_04050 [Coraliomargarita sp. SDUM461004]|uniref:Uncharacterized protein n=1 Tax=Thalassobacterium sedimentorum TaxID=3041258 RepID=A0ABU1AFY3_9BACT|nr:hypothetical protein [Coraliomargarita sp. SDUM461004]MDQ8193582.1 hypothetical protein [Coraliomargarita sp. SDUM461004]
MLRLLLACTLFTLCNCGPQQTSQELEGFAAAFRIANQAADIEPMLALYQLDGSTEQTISLLKNALSYELGMPIKRIEFEALHGSPEETIYYSYQGVHYGPTLTPQLRMRVRYDTDDHFESLFSIGRNQQGDWRIVSSQPLQPQETLQK